MLMQNRKLCLDHPAASPGPFGLPRRVARHKTRMPFPTYRLLFLQRQLEQAVHTVSQGSALARMVGSATWFRNRKRIPFRPMWSNLSESLYDCTSTSDFSWGLGSTDSCATAVHTKPFSTSVHQGLASVFATTTKICTNGGSTRLHSQRFCAHRCDPPTRHGFLSRHFENDFSSPANTHLPVTVKYRHDARAPSIFRASCFGR
jgi:hypothetical protein